MFTLRRFKTGPVPIEPQLLPDKYSLLVCLPPPEQLYQVMHNSKLPWRKWYEVIYMVNTKPHIKPAEVATSIGVSYETAKRMLARIREIM